MGHLYVKRAKFVIVQTDKGDLFDNSFARQSCKSVKTGTYRIPNLGSILIVKILQTVEI